MSNQGASRSGTLATLLCTHREKTGLTQRQLAGNGTSGLRVEVLGPLAVWRDGLPVPLGPVRQRAVLGLLILHAGTSVHRAAIIDALWGEDPPPTVVAMVHNHVSRIRRLVSGPPGGDVPLLWDGSGYRFIPGSIQLDVTQFGELTGQAEAQLAVGDAAGWYLPIDENLGIRPAASYETPRSRIVTAAPRFSSTATPREVSSLPSTETRPRAPRVSARPKGAMTVLPAIRAAGKPSRGNEIVASAAV